MATELRQVKLMMSDGLLSTADSLAELRGLNRQEYLRRLIEQDADHCVSQLRRLSWEMAREDDADAPAQAPGKPPAAGVGAPEGA